jgi:hypothetical protein
MKIGKMLMLALLGIFSLLTASNGYAQEEVTEPPFEKVYVSPDRILVSQEGLFYFNEEGNMIPVQLISSDAAGVYIVGKPVYICPGCGTGNTTNKCINRWCPLFGQ